jgi:hypothetical protein
MTRDPEAQEFLRKLAAPEPTPPRPGLGSPPKGGRAPDARGGPPPRDDRSGYLGELVGEAVRVCLVTGEVIEGRIASVKTYELQMADGTIVMKGSITMVKRATAPP